MDLRVSIPHSHGPTAFVATGTGKGYAGWVGGEKRRHEHGRLSHSYLISCQSLQTKENILAGGREKTQTREDDTEGEVKYRGFILFLSLWTHEMDFHVMSGRKEAQHEG